MRRFDQPAAPFESPRISVPLTMRRVLYALVPSVCVYVWYFGAGLLINMTIAVATAIALEALVGPEFVTGSTRMKAGTAQKLILNMITTSTMIKLGRVKGNKMVDMQLTNAKLVERGARMISEELVHELAFLGQQPGHLALAMVALNVPDHLADDMFEV